MADRGIGRRGPRPTGARGRCRLPLGYVVKTMPVEWGVAVATTFPPHPKHWSEHGWRPADRGIMEANHLDPLVGAK